MEAIDNLKNILPQNKKSLKSAVVLGCGGIKALAELPLLDYLRSHKVNVDVIFGTGGGATLGALYACGYTSNEIPGLMARIYDKKLFNQLDYSMVFKIMGMRSQDFKSPPAPYKNQPLLEVLKSIFGEKRLEELPQKIQIQATDMESGHEIDLTEGLIYECLYASNATYPFFPPIKIKNKFLASGMFTAALPVMQAVRNNYDVVFVVSVNDASSIGSNEMVEYINTFFMRACTNTQSKQITLAISLHEGEVVLLNVNFDNSINLWDSKAADEILLAGKKMIQTKKEAIDEAIKLFMQIKP